ncbi:hypothetical protein T265_02837 [Opisthorchis viverrini]|uniref:Uncharacterized protein n=1 Tax=Opisthorchis viverrini TaxID=6198 RepID=A0A074ZXV1_OPIVI|nr:hypothetical protein T265_02837 [Opisthorchis viverrini]KER30797.1 hypothetical protein T265_02837 [Opisthorchis viverrini]
MGEDRCPQFEPSLFISTTATLFFHKKLVAAYQTGANGSEEFCFSPFVLLLRQNGKPPSTSPGHWKCGTTGPLTQPNRVRIRQESITSTRKLPARKSAAMRLLSSKQDPRPPATR